MLKDYVKNYVFLIGPNLEKTGFSGSTMHNVSSDPRWPNRIPQKKIWLNNHVKNYVKHYVKNYVSLLRSPKPCLFGVTGARVQKTLAIRPAQDRSSQIGN